ncbi:MAG: hypothetical protein GY838_10185 [bacterium]|nr:hypothetical protein [bacterium]
MFAFVLAPVGWAAVYNEVISGGNEGDPGDGHNFAGGGGSSTGGIGDQDAGVSPEAFSPPVIYRFIPIVIVDGIRITVTFMSIEPPVVDARSEGGNK